MAEPRCALLSLLLAGCATSLPPMAEKLPEPSAVVEPTPIERACLESVSRTKERVLSDEFATCQRHSDCRGVSALLTGECGSVTNARVFEAHREEFQSQAASCDSVLQIVPRCLRLQPVCTAGRCALEPISELPDECAELRAVFAADADKANRCQVDSACTVLETGRTTAVSFVSGSVDQREQISRACGVVPRELYLVPELPSEAFCIEGRCMTEKATPQFTTVVKDRRTIQSPKSDRECVTRQFRAAFTDDRRLRDIRSWVLEYTVNLDANGRQNQFDFRVPADLRAEAKRALASRLRECPVEPARYRGKPVAIRWNVRIEYTSR